jgi:hypothetical protein
VVIVSSPKADALAEQAERTAQHLDVKGRRVLFLLLGLIIAGLGGLTGLAGYTLYEIHSCVTPGWPCNNRNAQQSAVIVGQLTESHVEIQQDLRDIKRLLLEMRQP